MPKPASIWPFRALPATLFTAHGRRANYDQRNAFGSQADSSGTNRVKIGSTNSMTSASWFAKSS